MKLVSCKARQHSDQMMCHQCGLQWDVNDPDPPPCNQGKRVETKLPETTNKEESK